jgi:hypothetical protein
MSASEKPTFFGAPWGPVANLAAGNTNRTVSGVTGLVALGAVAPAGGRHVERAVFFPTGNTTAGVVRVWQRVADAGDAQLIGEMAVAAVTASATVAQLPTKVELDFFQAAGDRLYVSSHTADAWVVRGEGSE